jgi:hypothetical protein
MATILGEFGVSQRIMTIQSWKRTCMLGVPPWIEVHAQTKHSDVKRYLNCGSVRAL